jgi:hypothetical protein
MEAMMPGLGSAFFRPLVIAMGLLVMPVLATNAPAQQTLVQQFLQNPNQILQQYPNGGTAMISQLREIAIADPNALTPIINLIATANKDQKTAIGAALGQAAKVVVKTNQAYANSILQQIAQTKDQDVFLAYSGVVPDQATAAIGGGGGAGGGVGGQTSGLGGLTGGTGGAEGIGGGSTPTGPFSFTSSVSGSGTTGGTTTSNFTTITSSTSP